LGKCHQFSRAKNGGHVESWAAIGRRNTPHHSYTSGSKKVPACVRKYCFNALIFGNISSAGAKEYLIAARY